MCKGNTKHKNALNSIPFKMLIAFNFLFYQVSYGEMVGCDNQDVSNNFLNVHKRVLVHVTCLQELLLFRIVFTVACFLLVFNISENTEQ